MSTQEQVNQASNIQNENYLRFKLGEWIVEESLRFIEMSYRSCCKKEGVEVSEEDFGKMMNNYRQEFSSYIERVSHAKSE
jgi:hypothetical protein